MVFIDSLKNCQVTYQRFETKGPKIKVSMEENTARGLTSKTRTSFSVSYLPINKNCQAPRNRTRSRDRVSEDRDNLTETLLIIIHLRSTD
jgi:hypothetical protein